jgi:UDP-N-acetylmuramoylalanine--D-glutamate ligase
MFFSKNRFVNKKILIYGFGRTGLSSYLFLKKNNSVFIYDDKKSNKLFIKRNDFNKIDFDFIVISPGIDIKKCHLKKFLKNKNKKIVTDLDIFYSHYSKNKNITITGTNGKSTTAKILYDILKSRKLDVRLTGNIGNPILSEKQIKAKTIFVIEASSYQIDYSKNFKANFASILNITPDHLDRHGSFSNYIKIKLKLIKNQKKNDYSFLNFENKNIKKSIKKIKLRSKIIKVNTKSINKYLPYIKNRYFLTEGNKENLSFILAIIKKLRIKKNYLFKVINNFKELKFRQEIIFKSKKFILINDSKATSFSSSINVLKSLNYVYWLLGGIPKKGDKFIMLKKDCKNFKAYIFGKNKIFFNKELKNKMTFSNFNDLETALRKVIIDVKISKEVKEVKTILFSPSAASFDTFKNFEDRGEQFNKLIKKLKLKKIINARH